MSLWYANVPYIGYPEEGSAWTYLDRGTVTLGPAQEAIICQHSAAIPVIDNRLFSVAAATID